MTRQELMAFLDMEANKAITKNLPKIFNEIGNNLNPNGQKPRNVDMTEFLSHNKDPNVKTTANRL